MFTPSPHHVGRAPAVVLAAGLVVAMARTRADPGERSFDARAGLAGLVTPGRR